MKWLSPTNKIYTQVGNNKRITLVNYYHVVILDSEHHAKELGWKKIELEKDNKSD